MNTNLILMVKIIADVDTGLGVTVIMVEILRLI